MSLDHVSADLFKQAMRRLAAGVTIVTTCHNGTRGGLTATAVCSLTADPPQVVVCVNRAAAAHALIAVGQNLCVNLLARKHKALAGRFAGAKGIFGEERFAAGRWTTLKTGAPVLGDALASFDCALQETVESSTHTIFIGRVVDVRVRPNGQPLLYAGGTYAAIRALNERHKRRSARVRRLRGAKKVRAKRA